MRKIHINFLVALVSLFLSQIVSAQNKDYATYETSDFSIHYPADWRVEDKETKGTRVFFFSPLESADDHFSENINIITQDISDHPMTLKEYTDLSLQQIKTLATNGKLIESKTIQTPNGETQRLVYKADQGQFHLEFEQLYIIQKGKVYLITYTAEVKSFKKYLAKANEVLESFRIKQ